METAEALDFSMKKIEKSERCASPAFPDQSETSDCSTQHFALQPPEQEPVSVNRLSCWHHPGSNLRPIDAPLDTPQIPECLSTTSVPNTPLSAAIITPHFAIDSFSIPSSFPQLSHLPIAASDLFRRRRPMVARACRELGQPGTTLGRISTVPEDQKDAAYWEHRRKNNDAAKRSRENRRMKEDEIASRAAVLEQENLQLRAELSVLRQQRSRLHLILLQTSQAM